MNMRLSCLIGIAVCFAVTFWAPHYHLAAKVIGITLLGFAILTTFLEGEPPRKVQKKPA
ncbi:hypothetical protein WSS15_03320 [Acetobacter pasteurianus]|uniref:Uncharacterized protein n=5 Tax=Acetobacter pasteurianus TaxID=438 RepID=A0A401WS00_ACEPA|nr:hypothetical protein [Acetobacter pasteurianus]BAU37932.1 hypothetical protein APT_00850 [Acetobacter pasteurianus NBRC 101655]ASC04600.1 hypothetical protein S101468_00329 [Acetobacter pasteurianus subsp. pasteurianus]OAZ72774.1 hypothetical protein SRCM100623_01317 [Acetobacter pasteurianus]WKC16424.1 hypothetical protein FCN51_14415 [Acetobacter pasteurianus]CCT60448.1 hypothetical protein APA386B_2408 [Acetobacter pasteurianus 386B]